MLELRHFKRMIYYYFTSKEQLYLAVLEKLYGDIRATEAALKLDQLDPEAAIRCLVEFTFEHHDSNVDFIRLVSIENIHHGVHLAQSQVIRSLISSFCFFRVSNRHTFATIHQVDFSNPETRARHKEMI